jgi:hypothetical protein
MKLFFKMLGLIRNTTIFALVITGCSVARLSRLLWEQEAAGSNPATPTKSCRNAGLFCYKKVIIFYHFFCIIAISK